MTPFLSLLLLSSLQGEPDGSRTLGIVPPFKAEPAPPPWLRPTSHAHARPDTRHYVYEAYAGEKRWLVRYLMLPEEGERPRTLELVMAYKPKGREKGIAVPLSEVEIKGRAVHWKGEVYRLVDKRDLLKP